MAANTAVRPPRSGARDEPASAPEALTITRESLAAPTHQRVALVRIGFGIFWAINA